MERFLLVFCFVAVLSGLLVEYNRYLKEVVTALESDPEFKMKLEKAEESDIRSGKIAYELENVNHRVRTKLDEIKRTELERLRHLATKEYELRHGMDTEHLKIPPEHVDLSNPHTFEIEDLRKLILKTTADIAEADRKRRQEFKEYEMQKEFEKQEKLKSLDDQHKQQMLKDMEDKEKKHKQHEPLHHPGSKQQLEEVWETQDHMENQDFNPRIFFHLHDLDGNGVWDADEVKALFLKELDKMYSPGAAEDDMRERIEELERMREHVFKEADTNKDGLISYEEFLAQTQKPEFERDSGWDGLDEQQIYTQDEYREFEMKRQEEIQRLIAQGVILPYPNGMPPPHTGYQRGAQGHQYYQQQFPPHHQPGIQYGQVQSGQQVPQYGGQVPHPNQIPQGQVYGNQLPQGQIYPQGQMHPGQVPQGQLQPKQVGQLSSQIQPGQVPSQVHPGQVPPQVHPGQAPIQVQPGQASSQVPSQVLPGQAPPQHVQVPIQSQQGQNTNINPLPQQVAQPVEQLRDPLDVNKLHQGEDNADISPPTQVQKAH
ncbi:hypothetical protein Cfor_00760 [Coptotermes formosanus]|uniref:EF-hand domain-containing protein n=1 Tax=Coptotermes formosanus TaxID=36987 RepID=A0A6L2PI44_COPFO|nr:hypothetical protein Cfor_00760 [Coptotermes formosanus]